jgi:hypothetical protein
MRSEIFLAAVIKIGLDLGIFTSKKFRIILLVYGTSMRMTVVEGRGVQGRGKY